MNLPAWLAELHRQWHAARGRRIAETSRAFSRDWAKLLERAGITSAEDQATAGREAEALESAGNLLLKRHRYRKYLIERITLPLGQETWLQGLFGGIPSIDLQAASLEIVTGFFPTRTSAVSGRMGGALCITDKRVLIRALAAAVQLDSSGNAAQLVRNHGETQRTRMAGGHDDSRGQRGSRLGFQRPRTAPADF